MTRLRTLLRFSVPRAVLLLSGLAMGTIGSCTLPTIKPPSL
jgi:hypothetical protein